MKTNKIQIPDISNNVSKPISIEYVIFLLLLISIIFTIIQSHFFSVPITRDEGEYAYTAQIMNEGYLPYHDAFSQKPPGIFIVYLLILKLFGSTIESIRIGACVFNLATILSIFWLGKLIKDEFLGLLSAFIFAVVLALPTVVGINANTETFMILPMMSSILTFVYWLKSKKSGLYPKNWTLN